MWILNDIIAIFIPLVRFVQCSINKKMFPSRYLIQRIILIFLVNISFLYQSFNPAFSQTLVRRSFYTMGTELVFELLCEDTDYCYEVIQKAHGEVLRLDRIFSNYRTDSELYSVVNSNHKFPVKLSDDFYNLTAASIFVSILTDGAFDITAGSLVTLWKDASKKGQIPDPSAIEMMRTDCVGVNKLGLISKNMSLKLSSDCVDLDYGAIGKGYALDKIIEVLKDARINGAIINFGGNIYAKGKDTEGKKWNILLKTPPSLKDKIKLDPIYISDLAVSTSGGYERYFEIQNRKYSHILDPRSGYPVDESKSVTVVSSNATLADALSTAFSVMSISEVKELLYTLDNIGVLIVSDNSRYENDYFRKLHKN